MRAAATASVVWFGLLVLASASGARGASLSDAGERFWAWRAVEQPFSADDIPRIERPHPFEVDWSAAAIARRETDLEGFEREWRELAPARATPVHDQVDYRLWGSAIARVRWELDLERRWQRDPGFYVDQTLGSVVALLLPPPPFSSQRQDDIIARLRRIPATLADARRNLTDMRQPFAQLAIEGLDGIAAKLASVTTALTLELDTRHRRALAAAMPPTAAALERYRAWLEAELPRMRTESAIGRDAYLYFLRNVALLPYQPEELLAMSRAEWSRAVDFETYQQARLEGLPPAPLAASTAAQLAAERSAEQKVRDFLTREKILSVPEWAPHYLNRPLPGYLEPLRDITEADDFTGPSRLNAGGTSYIRPPDAVLGFFDQSRARDPRPIIVHEGVPGHYFQLVLGWHNPDVMRRHYYDSGANEGIGFYAEEMMLQAGLFDDDARTRGVIYTFMRLRALRVAADVKLALGEFTIPAAAEYLERTVPMDKATALGEAALFASTPGQGISYQIGKLQIMALLADARRAQGTAFSLLAFNDFVWNNGNVPIALQRWELLGDESQVPAIMAMPATAAVPPGPSGTALR